MAGWRGYGVEVEMEIEWTGFVYAWARIDWTGVGWDLMGSAAMGCVGPTGPVGDWLACVGVGYYRLGSHGLGWAVLGWHGLICHGLDLHRLG